MPMNFNPGWFDEQEVEHPSIKHHKIDDAFKSHSVISGFTLTAGMAHYQGYFQDDDIEVPVCSQFINTDGQRIQFSFYQLNTLGTSRF